MASSKINLQQTFENALSPNEKKQLEFIQTIDTLVQIFPATWIKTQFVPFLVQWLPKEIPSLPVALSKQLTYILTADEKFSFILPLVELLVAFENPTISSAVTDALLECGPRQDSSQFLSDLLKSRFDTVRAFAPSLITLVKSKRSSIDVLKIAVNDLSTIVRLGVVRSLSKVPSEVSEPIATLLIKDPSSKVRGGLPFFCAPFSFFSTLLVPNLVSDPDWYVRSSIAAQLPKMLDAAVPYLQQLIGDRIWQVKLRALRSLCQALSPAQGQSGVQTKNGLQPIYEQLVGIFTIGQDTLKVTVIDAFFVVYKILGYSSNEKVCAGFVAKVVETQPPSIILHLLTKIAESKDSYLFSLVAVSFQKLVQMLINQAKWRIRLGIVSVLYDLSLIDSKIVKENEMIEFLLKNVEDKSNTVREAVVKQLVQFSLSGKGELKVPAFYTELKKSFTFRRRQAALEYLNQSYRSTSSDAFRKFLLQEMQSFSKDPCRTVVLLAQSLITINSVKIK